MNILAAILLSCYSAFAAGVVPLAWTASPTPGVTKQTVYLSHDTNFATGVVKQSVPGTGTNAVISSSLLSPGQWFAAVTATVGSVESLPSQTAVVTVFVPQVTVQYFRGPDLAHGVEFDRKTFDETNGAFFYWEQITR